MKKIKCDYMSGVVVLVFFKYANSITSYLCFHPEKRVHYDPFLYKFRLLFQLLANPLLHPQFKFFFNAFKFSIYCLDKPPWVVYGLNWMNTTACCV